MSTSLVQTGVKFPDDTVLTSSIPVGATFIQFPGKPAPNSIFGGSWSAIFDNEGVFFRTPGGEASSFGGGIQSDQMQRITGNDTIGSEAFNRGTRSGAFLSGSSVGGARNTGVANGGVYRINLDTSSSPNARTSSSTDGETRPQNRTIRVWKKTS